MLNFDMIAGVCVGPGRAGGGVSSRSHEHVRQVMALDHLQLQVHIDEAGGVLMPELGEVVVCGLALELHGIGTDLAGDLERGCPESVLWTTVVCKLVTMHPE
jgi:hypothetical protein